jgi:hypothetical protein
MVPFTVFDQPAGRISDITTYMNINHTPAGGNRIHLVCSKSAADPLNTEAKLLS